MEYKDIQNGLDMIIIILSLFGILYMCFKEQYIMGLLFMIIAKLYLENWNKGSYNQYYKN